LSHQDFVEIEDEYLGTLLRALKILTLKKAYKHNKTLRMDINISIFRMLLTLIKTSDKFEDGPSGTTLRALKNLTSKKFVKQ